MKYFLCLMLMAGALMVRAQRNVMPTDHFTITGLVKQSLAIDMNTISKYPEVTIGDMAIKSQRGEDKETAHAMKGVLLKTFIDSAGIDVNKPKELNGIYIVLIASDGYKSVYSWNELFNNDMGNHVYIVTEQEGKKMQQADGAILVVCTADINTGRRHLKGLQTIKVKMAD